MRRRSMRLCGLFVAAAILATGVMASPAEAQGPEATGTPAEMVATYNALADGILALKATEAELVRSILATTFAHGQVQFARAQKAIGAKDAAGARAGVEALAAAVAQLGTEGDNSVGAVRKRLVQGGHHHNAAGEAQGIFDEGYVVVTKAAKQKFLASSRAIGQMAANPTAAALEAEWKNVQAAYAELMKKAK